MAEQSHINKFLEHPTKGPSTAFATFFLFSCGLHIWQSRHYHTWSCTWPLPFACILMAAGFICREVQAFGHSQDLASSVQGLFNGAVATFPVPLYIFLLRFLAVTQALASTHLTLYYFAVTGFNSAIIACLAQGAATYFNPDATPGAVSSGLALIKASLFLQLFLNVQFIALLVMLVQLRHIVNNRTWDRQMIVWMFCILMTLILVRNLFRTVQIFMSPLSSLWQNEAYFWVFEGCLILIFTALFHAFHLGKYQPFRDDDSSDIRHLRRES